MSEQHAKKKETVVVGLPTAASQAKPRLPLPTGSIQLKKLSPAERRRLEQLGWAGQDELPENFVSIAEAAFQATTGRSPGQIRAAAVMSPEEVETDADLAAELQRRVGRDFQRAGLPPEVDIQDLPPAQQTEYRQLLASVLEQRQAERQQEQELDGLPASVASAAREADRHEPGPPLVDDRQGGQYATGAAKPAEHAHGPADPRTGLCARCGYPKDQFYDIPVTEEEKDLYQAAALYLQPLESQVTLMGGRLHLRWRALGVDDNDSIWKQLLLDEAAGHVSAAAEKMEYAQRYRIVLSLIRYETPDNVYTFPGSLDNWPPVESTGRGRLWDCWSVVRQTLKLNESVYRLVAGEQLKFALKLQKMEQLAEDENFWKAGVSSS